MRSVSENYYGRIGSSILIASFYMISTSQMLLSQNIMINFLFWFFIAVAIGQVRKNN
jgi:membrane associated rhomboid family serine protease